MTIETFRFQDEYDNGYVISSTLSSARARTEGKRGGRRHSTTSFSENVEVAETRYQMLEVLSFCDR